MWYVGVGWCGNPIDLDDVGMMETMGMMWG